MIRPLLLASLAAALAAAAPAHAQRGDDQDEAYSAAQRGAIRPLGDILRRVGPQVGGTFLGSDFDPDSRTYRLKYMNQGRVVVVDVDARSGTIRSVSGK